jgi:hypothetical protein
VSLLLRIRSEDLLQCRFAVSPLNETADALRSLARPGAAAYHLSWQRQARDLVPGLGIEPLLAILAVHGTSLISSARPRTARSLRSAPNSTGFARPRRRRSRRS